VTAARRQMRKWGRPCGRPHSHRRVVSTEVESLTPGVVRALAVRSAALCRPALAPVPVPSGDGESPKTSSCHPAVPRPVFQPGSSTGSAMRGIASPSEPAGKSGLPTAHLRGFNGLEVAASEDALAFIPPPRGISPSRRVRFQSLFFFPGFTPSIRRANPRSRCLEDAPRARVGQAAKGLVIHFQPFCRWTRVDNFRFKAEIRDLSPVAFGQ